MRGALQIAKFFGIPVQVHWTFLLIFVYVFFLGYRENWSWVSMGWSGLFVTALFVCVVLHEFGHALTARRFGVNTRDIILSPIGGVARLDRLPEKPMQEFHVAIAGPLVNVGISLALSPYFLLVSGDTRQQLQNILLGLFYPESNIFVRDLTPFDYFLFGLIALNLTLALFNLLPAFPMDGGRVLRALLSLRLGRRRATRVAAYIGQAFAVLLVVYAVWQFSIITAFIGIFVFTTAANEYRMVQLDTSLSQHTVAALSRRNFTKIYLDDPIEIAAEAMRRGLEKNFLVFDRWQNLAGVLTEASIMEAMKKGEDEQKKSVADYLNTHFSYLSPEDSLKEAFNKMQWENYLVMPVYEKGRISGLVDAGMLNNFLRLQQKINR